MNIKRKIINDPVYGFINMPQGIAYEIIEHPYFQRLRRIKQLGLTHLVYPGAIHTRFQHALGAGHLLFSAIEVIRSKKNEITEEEAEAVLIAILLHDIGHGPFSHSLENVFIEDISHEELSLVFMRRLNAIYNNKLNLAISVFQDKYPKRFLHQLVSSQLDVDRMDYLGRDSFFTGVSEGVIGFDRIIKMLQVVNDNLVVEAKGIYSIENYLIARRLMFWQVYFHKTVVAANQLLVKIMLRAKHLASKKIELFATPELKHFLYNKITKNDFIVNNKISKKNHVVELFAQLDDSDIITSIKVWTKHSDKTLSLLSTMLINRKLFKIELQNQPFSHKRINQLKKQISQMYNISFEDAEYFVFTDYVTNNAYSAVNDDRINILFNNGKLVDIAEASDMLNISVLSKTVKKYFLCYPK